MKELLRKVRRLELKTRRKVESTFAGEYHSAFKGQGLEFDEVRLYQFGDDIRSIDWNVTAKTNEVFIKLFKEEREQTLFVLFDISGSENFGPEQENKLLVGTEITAVLAFSAMKNNDKIGLATFTDRIERFFPPSKGRSHILSMIRGLVLHKANGRETKIKTALDFARKILKRRSILIVVSDFLDEDYTRSLAHLARRHDLILIRLFNPRELLNTRTGTIPVHDLETGITAWINSSAASYRNRIRDSFQKVEQNLQDISRRYRIDLVTIDTTGDYMEELEKFFRKRNARR